MKKHSIDFGRRQRPSLVFSGKDITGELPGARFLKEFSSIFLVVDKKVAGLYPQILRARQFRKAPVYLVPSGESQKSEKRLHTLLNWLSRHNADRQSLVVAIGGGVVTDLTGFAASCYMRGIDFISLPTTLLGQVDSAIGGKTGINFEAVKNLIGSFYPPRMVICDHRFLDSLSVPSIKDGLVEAIKAFAATNRRSFEKYADTVDKLINKCELSPLINDAIAAKIRVVRRDPFERDYRRVLNFGHTAGHAYETVEGVSHGKAVAFGILIALELSRRFARLTAADTGAVRDVILRIYSCYSLKRVTAYRLWQRILHDKKRSGAEINFVLLNGIGKHQIKAISSEQFKEALILTLEQLKQ